LRAQVCANLDFCGLELDAEANARARVQEAVISTSRSKIEVRIIPTNEELIIARNAWEKLSSLKPQTHTEN
jgi:acetate kinase